MNAFGAINSVYLGDNPIFLVCDILRIYLFFLIQFS